MGRFGSARRRGDGLDCDFCDAWVDGLVGRDPLFLATRNVVAVVTLHFGARVSP